MESAVKILLDGLIGDGRHSLSTTDDYALRSLIGLACHIQKKQIIDAYEDGYNAAFHHEQSHAERYYMETYSAEIKTDNILEDVIKENQALKNKVEELEMWIENNRNR